MTELGDAIKAISRRSERAAQSVVQLAVVQSVDPLVLELTESRHVVHADELVLAQSVKQYDAGDGIQPDDVAVLVRKIAGGEAHWIVTDVVADADSQGTSTRVASLEGVSLVPFPYAAGWADRGAGFEGCSYSSRGKAVKVQGLATKTSGAPAAGDVIGTLPAGFRPGGTLIYETATGATDVRGRVHVHSNGDVTWEAGSTTETDNISLSPISFEAV